MDSELVRDSELWFEDGNLVLQAEQTLFRIYSGILSRASTVVKDMLIVGQAQPEKSAGLDRYDGCPLVVMSGDSAVDMRAFLNALYDSRYFMTAPSIDDIPRLVSVLRISTKYDIAGLRRQAVEALKIYYPVDSSVYKPSLDSATQNRDFIHHILVANVARETSANKLLPAALLRYCCTAGNPRELYDGTSGPDGTHHELLPVNRRAAFIGQHSLGFTAHTRTFIRNIKARCSSSTSTYCKRGCDRLSAPYDLHNSQILDPFFPFFRIHLDELKEENCCEWCRSTWENDYQRKVEKLWRDLPAIFDLPAWSVILADDLAGT